MTDQEYVDIVFADVKMPNNGDPLSLVLSYMDLDYVVPNKTPIGKLVHAKTKSYYLKGFIIKPNLPVIQMALDRMQVNSMIEDLL